MKIQLLAAAALAVFTAGPGAVTASSLRGAVDLDLALEYATDMYPKVDVYSDYDFDPEDEEEDSDLDLDMYDEDGEDMDLISYNNRRTSASNRNRRFNRMVRNGNYKRANRLGDRIDRARQWRGRNSYRNFRRNFNGNGISRQACRDARNFGFGGNGFARRCWNSFRIRV